MTEESLGMTEETLGMTRGYCQRMVPAFTRASWEMR